MLQKDSALAELRSQVLSYLKGLGHPVLYVDILNAIGGDPLAARAVLQAMLKSGELAGEIGSSRYIRLTPKGELALLELQSQEKPNDNPHKNQPSKVVHADLQEEFSQKLRNELFVAAFTVLFTKLVDLLPELLRFLLR